MSRNEEIESQIKALNCKIYLLEEDLERSEERLTATTQKLADALNTADEQGYIY